MSKHKDYKGPYFPFKKMPFQEKGESDHELHEYDLESTEELDIGESDKRQRRRTLRDERDAGQEP